MKGRLRDIVPMGKKSVVSLELEAPAAAIEEHRGKDLDVSLKTYRERRSLDSNAYFHVLCDRLRQKLGITMAECKNHLIASYGQIEYIGEQQAVIKTNIEPEQMIQNEYLHAWLVKVDVGGVYFYRVYRGTHTYNSAEMAQLIKGTVEECQTQGIETATPDEIAKMNALWGEKHDGLQEAGEIKQG